MTEEDTFKRLKRVSFNQMSEYYKDWWISAGRDSFLKENYWPENDKLFESYGWTYMEWINESKKEL
jgi:hypothetical protein